MWSRQDLFELRAHRLGTGEYYIPRGGEADVSVQVARTLFLAALRERAPEVSASCEASVLPQYDRLCKAAAELGTDTSDRWFNVEWLLGDEWIDSPHEVPMFEWSSFRRAIVSWADKIHLNHAWFLQEVLSDLHSYWRDLARPEDARLGFPLGNWWGWPAHAQGCPLPFEDHQFRFMQQGPSEVVEKRKPRLDASVGRFLTFVSGGWDPLFMTANRFEDRAREQFEQSLKAYVQGMRQYMEALGYVKTPRKRNPMHYDMLAERLVRGTTWRELAGALGMKTRAAQYAVEAAAAEAQIPLPAGNPGRRTSRPVAGKT